MKRETKSELLARIKTSVNPNSEFTLKELAWAYVHGAPAGSDDEKLFARLLRAKARST